MIDLVSSVLAASVGVGQSFLTYAVPFVFVLSIVVFFHELGHFLVARWCGVAVETFSIGFGKALFSWKDKHGTRWQVAWLPLGGYVKFVGDANAISAPGEGEGREAVTEEEAARRAAAGHFHFKPVGQRSLVVAAGPVANFILAIVIFAATFAIVGEQRTLPVVGAVEPGSAAEAAGFAPQDRVLSINGGKIDSFEDMVRAVALSGGSVLTIDVARDGQVVELKAAPRAESQEDPFYGPVYRLGIKSDPEGNGYYVRFGPIAAIAKGVEQTGLVISDSLSAVGRLVSGHGDPSQLSGVVGIAKVSGEVAQRLGFLALLNLAAVLSVSIGLLNLFPIPMLDGGHLLYYAYEAVRGRPLGERAQEFGFRVGIALVLSLMIFATWNDLVKLQIFG